MGVRCCCFMGGMSRNRVRNRDRSFCIFSNFWGNALTKPRGTQSFFFVRFVPRCATSISIFGDNTSFSITNTMMMNKH